jgi:hypothetical protein
MANKDQKTYWPHMILGFLGIGIMLGYWTIKSAINMPVSESNEYQLKYQQADMNINQILESKARFDKKYKIEFLDFAKSDFKPNKFLKRKHGDILKLSSINNFSYSIKGVDGTELNDANATLLVTRPHSRKDDSTITLKNDGHSIYRAENIALSNAGRYIIRLKVQKGNDIGFKEFEAYLEPK